MCEIVHLSDQFAKILRIKPLYWLGLISYFGNLFSNNMKIICITLEKNIYTVDLLDMNYCRPTSYWQDIKVLRYCLLFILQQNIVVSLQLDY